MKETKMIKKYDKSINVYEFWKYRFFKQRYSCDLKKCKFKKAQK